MKKIILFSAIILGILFCTVRIHAQSAQVSPVANLSGSNASVINDNEQILQTGINGIVGLFSQYFSNGILNASAGGTGQNSSNWTIGDLIYMSNTGIWNHEAPSTIISPVTSNTLFQYVASVSNEGSNIGEYSGTSINANNATGNYRYLQSRNTSYTAVWTTQWQKIAGVSTVTIVAQIWTDGANSTNLKVDIGGVNSNVSGTAGMTTPEWKAFTINVSSLTNGTFYTVTASILTGGVGSNSAYLGTLMAFGS